MFSLVNFIVQFFVVQFGGFILLLKQ